MFYLDTSVLVAYYCPEPLSERVESFVTTHEQLAVSRLVELEMFSGVSRRVREENLEENDGARILATFLSHLDGRFYEVAQLTDHHYRLARDWIALPKNTLRTLDALHLVIASAEAMQFYTKQHKYYCGKS
jgi:uncharacterized protein